MKIKQGILAILVVNFFTLPMVVAHTLFDHFAVFVEGTYTKPTNNGLSVGDQVFAISPGEFPNGNGLDGGYRHVFLNPENDLDYAVGFTYHLENTQVRFFLRYDHYTNYKEQGFDNIRTIGLEPLAVPTSGFASVRISAYEFSVGFIKEIPCKHFCLDVLAYLEHDKIAQNLLEINRRDFFLTIEEIVRGGNNNRTSENVMHGVGPGIGIMGRVSPFACFRDWEIFAGGKWALLFAKNVFKETFYHGDSTFYIYDPQGTDSLVGKLDILFGINYHHALICEMNGMMWDITLGMRYMNMFNVLKNGNVAYNPDAELTIDLNHTGPSSFAANLGFTQDWGRWGPFLQIKIGGGNS